MTNSEPTFAIQAEGLTKTYGTTRALAGVDLAVRPGTVLGLLGPNGAGKTTAVRMLATLLKPDAGTALVCGLDVVREADQVRRRIGLTGQFASVDEEMTGTQNLVLIGRLLDLTRAGSRRRAAALLERFGLADAADKKAGQYSGGMRRRLDLASSLVGRPEVLFLDEPTTGLDPRSRNEVWDIVRSLVADGTTVLLTTQYLDEADQLADEITVVDHGTVVASGTAETLKTEVGGHTLQVRPVDPGRLDDAAGILGELAGAVPDMDRAVGRAWAPVADPALLSALVRRLDDAGIVAHELGLRQASLDEVFLALTGHPTQDSATQDSATANDDNERSAA